MIQLAETGDVPVVLLRCPVRFTWRAVGPTGKRGDQEGGLGRSPTTIPSDFWARVLLGFA